MRLTVATPPAPRKAPNRANAMKLVFPGGEHPQVLLNSGINRIGSDPESEVRLFGTQPLRGQINVTAQGVMLQVPDGAPVRVNGRDIDGLIALRAGDRIAFDDIEARLTALEAPATQEAGAGVAPANDDLGATTVRVALPRYVLRGVAGRMFGRTVPMAGPITVGRAPECTLTLEDSGLSRLHARLLPTEEGVRVEDLGSTNGTTINGRRVLHGQAQVGDEIGFDTVRFRLLSPGHEFVTSAPERRDLPAWRSPWLLGGATVGLLLAILLIVL